ncbi:MULTISPECIES: selenium-dependent molybdenum cofactor biosynthesis protein YqeB [Anaerotruncus]|uniref:selenium-dependent molybdenum cofactor biosynthesis protein YqeB n=1 Tax=Anaerotruncus TaxID=244127 RepID=UPI00207FF5DE|nr:selenium-dependent molybdenum cofactor biosynthesis protein YqeB [Anaerotruncus massiliensis (ex Togo et al. 2019)]GKH47372.1 molybdenum hydroxylase [Oscillospiraceae bacterium]
MLIFIKGAGDLATGVAWRLHNCGFQVVMTDIARPTAVRCTVAFSRAVYEGAAEIEGVTARLARDPADALRITGEGEIAVLVDPEAAAIETLRPPVVIDAVLAKRNLGTRITDAPVVIALGPGFTAGADCHAVVETKRGHYLGRVIYAGSAIANTGVPGDIGGYTSERIIRAPADGPFAPAARIGQLVRAGDVVARVEGEPVRALIDGVVRGMLPEGTPVTCGMKSGDIDPRGIVEYCHTISDKARAIAGGALEAVLHLRGGVL